MPRTSEPCGTVLPPGQAGALMLPPRLIPLLYFGAAHLALASAFFLAAIMPDEITGFYYHPRLIGVVHLVTLGWISLSILGAIYIVGPLALRMPMRAGRVDYAAWGVIVIGISGMVSHFLLESYSGMAWSASMVFLGILPVCARVIVSLPGARIPLAVKMHVGLAFLNLLLAAMAGVLTGFDRGEHFLPVRPISLAVAHAHLAAIGWAAMMVAGTGYRLLPMVLPSAMPSGPSLWTSVLLLETGAVGLFVSLAAEGGLSIFFGATAAAGLIAFLLHVQWMRLHPRRPPVGRPWPDFAVLHAVGAMIWLIATIVAGLVLTVAPESEWSFRLASLYGLVGLVGFLSQMVVGVGARILPTFASIHAARHAASDAASHAARETRRVSGGADTIADLPSARELPSRPLQAAAFMAWTGGVPLMAGGLWMESDRLVSAGGWVLLGGVLIGGLGNVLILRHAFRGR